MRAVAEPAQLLQQYAGYQADHENGHGGRGHTHEKFDEVPARTACDQEVLRFPHRRTDTAERGAHGAMHEQVAQKRSKGLQVRAVDIGDGLVFAVFVVITESLAGGYPVVHAVEIDCHADDDGGYRQRIEKGGEHRGDQAEQERDNGLRADAQNDLGEGEQQQLFHEVDAGNHEDQQQDHREGGEDFVGDRVRRRHADEHSFQGDQPAGLQRIAAQRHGQRENELENDDPAGGERADRQHQQRVGNQKGDDGRLVPVWRLAEKIVPVGERCGLWHQR